MKKLLVFLFAIISFTTFAQDRPFKTSGPLWIMQGNNQNLIINKVTGDTAYFNLSNETLEFIVNNIKLSKITFGDNTFMNSAVAGGGVDTTVIATRNWVLQQLEAFSGIDTSHLRNDITNLQNELRLKADSLDNATRSWVLLQGYGSGGTPTDTLHLRTDITNLQNAILLKADSLDNATRTYIALQNFLKTYIETDPVFSMWDKSTGISITESQISDFGSYLTAETDPAFSSWNKSDGISITESQISDLQSYLTANSILPSATNPVYYVTINALGEWQIDTLLDFSKLIHRHLKSDSLTVNDFVSIGGVQTYIHTETFLTTQGILLPASKSGYGTIQLGNNVSTIDFSFDTSAVIKIRYSSGVGLTLTDSGTQVFIANTSGITDKIKLSIFLD